MDMPRDEKLVVQALEQQMQCLMKQRETLLLYEEILRQLYEFADQSIALVENGFRQVDRLVVGTPVAVPMAQITHALLVTFVQHTAQSTQVITQQLMPLVQDRSPVKSWPTEQGQLDFFEQLFTEGGQHEQTLRS